MPRLVKPTTLPDNVNPEAIEVVSQLVKSGRQIFGSAAASLTWGIDGSEDGDVNAGLEGEHQTAGILRDWVVKHPTAMVVHSVGWPGSKGDTDHMLIVGRVVFLIDSKRWKSKRKYSVTPSGSIKRGTVDFPEGKVKMVPALNAWRKVLGSKVKISGVVCIAQDEVFVPRSQDWYKAPYRLVTAEELPSFLDEAVSKMKRENKDMVDLGLLTSVVVRSIKPFDRRKKIINMTALSR